MSARFSPSSRRRTAVVGALVVSSVAIAAAPAAAETLFDPAQSPLIVQGNACIGSGCASGNVSLMALGLKNHDTPGMRLEQSGGGFSPFTWDVAGNEANFFVRDVTNGSRLPFRIRPGAPTSSIDIAASGRVGIGTAAPAAALDVARADGTAKLQVTESSTTAAERTLGELVNNGPVGLRLADSDAGTGWSLSTTASSGFALTSSAGGTDRTALRVDPRGELTASGALQQSVDPAAQHGAETVDPAAILEAIEALPVERFSYADDPSGAQHLAPAGAGFRSALGVGADDTALAPGDVAAAALAGVRALAARPSNEGVTASVGTLDAFSKHLDARINGLDARTIEQHRSLDARAKRLEQTTATLTTQVTSLRASRSTMIGRIRTLERAERAQQRRTASLAASNASLRKRLAAIESAVAKLR